jgi:hypothetical protein
MSATPITLKPSGFRDVYWCHHVNEPAFLVAAPDGRCKCQVCGMSWNRPEDIDESEGHHWFLFHVNKPHWLESGKKEFLIKVPK